jgi:hypothetical protein
LKPGSNSVAARASRIENVYTIAHFSMIPFSSTGTFSSAANAV